MQRAALTGFVLLAACSGLLEQGEGDRVVVVEPTSRAELLAHDAIMATRPKATQLMVEHVNSTLAANGIVANVVRAADVENRVLYGLTNGTPDVSCPYLSGVNPSTTISCRFLVDQALEDAMLQSPALTQEVGQAVESEHGDELDSDELSFVKGWAEQAVLSGIDVGGVHAAAALRTMGLCDQTLDAEDTAFALGERQGAALVEQAEGEVLAAVAHTQCNTDVIAQNVLAAAEEAAAAFMNASPICGGYTPSDLAGQVNLGQAEALRVQGVIEGMRQAYEALRVRLVGTWDCERSCTCYKRWVGLGEVYCFNNVDIQGREPVWGTQLPRLADEFGTVPQEACSVIPIPVGSPLVVDLDGEGIELGSERARFDLAATGEFARIPILRGNAALLVLDLDEDGRIESGAELFGNATACGEARCADGTRALAQHDLDGDWVIDAADPVYDRLQLWHDADHDGQSTPRELTPLAAAGIVEIGLRATIRSVPIDGAGDAYRSLTFRRADGSSGQIPDVWFHLGFDRMPRDPRTSGVASTLAP